MTERQDTNQGLRKKTNIHNIQEKFKTAMIALFFLLLLLLLILLILLLPPFRGCEG